MYKELDLKFTENWMKLLKEHINDVRLVDLKIPGSHNSNTYSFSAFGNSFAQNQKWTVEKQLQYGIRSLDLRYGLSKNKQLIIDKHGPIGGKNFFESIKQVKKFIQFHPDEFIIIKIQAESRLEPYHKNIFKQQISKHIGQYLIKQNDTWFDLSKVTMKQIFEKNKRIFLVCSDYLTDFIGCEEDGFFQKQQNYKTTWHDTDSRKKLFQDNKQILIQRALENKDILFVNEMILTTQRSTTHIFKRLVSIGLPTIENMVVRINEKNQVMNFIIKNRKQPFNIILLDRVDYKPLIVLMIVVLNIKSKLEVIKSFYKNQDILIKTQQCVFDDNFIYIQNINQYYPYKLEEQKNLNLIYRYNNSQNMLYQRNNLFQTLILYDNPLVREQYLNINAFSLIILNSKVIAKYKYIQEEDIAKKEKEIINNYLELKKKDLTLISLYSKDQEIIQLDELVKKYTNETLI